MQPLSGVALPVVAAVGKHAFTEAMLFTHRGLSGPAILQASSYWREQAPMDVDMLPGTDAPALLVQRKRARPRAEARTVLAELLPARLAHALADTHLRPGPVADLPDRMLAGLGAMSIVPVAISASHAAFTSVRVEPTFMVLGQAAGAAAALAPGGEVSKVNVVQLRRTLSSAGQILDR